MVNSLDFWGHTQYFLILTSLFISSFKSTKKYSYLQGYAKSLPMGQIGEGNGTPLQCSCLENPMDGGAWWAAVHGVTESRARLSDFTFIFHFPLSYIEEGNGNALQCSCLENSLDRGAWWATVHRVTNSWT